MDPNLSAVIVGRGSGSSQRTLAETSRLEVPHRPEHAVPGDLLRLRHAPNAMARQAYPQRMLRTAADNKVSMENIYKHPVVVLAKFGTEYLDLCMITSLKDAPLQEKYNDAQLQRRYIPNSEARYEHPLVLSDPRYAPLQLQGAAAFDRPGYFLARPVFRAHFSILEPYVATRYRGVAIHMALESERLRRLLSVAESVDFYRPNETSKTSYLNPAEYPPLGQRNG
nr:hypothetical protein B0A51_11894 [Rachicladosporium sp. CCFEE 5018]